MASNSLLQIVDRNVDADVRVGDELHALGRHLLHAAVDRSILHLEIGNAVAQQSADAVAFSKTRHIVAGARQLLRRGQARRARSDHRDALAGLRLAAARA